MTSPWTTEKYISSYLRQSSTASSSAWSVILTRLSRIALIIFSISMPSFAGLTVLVTYKISISYFVLKETATELREEFGKNSGLIKQGTEKTCFLTKQGERALECLKTLEYYLHDT